MKCILADSGCLEKLQLLYAQAREFMRKSGNPNQWGQTYPSADQILEDITQKRLYIIENEEKELCAAFVFFVGEEPSYSCIEGAWRSLGRYAVLHRVASSGKYSGMFDEIVRFCKRLHPYLRVDTHRKNIAMQKALQRNGFQFCGLIYLQDGSERLAYVRV